MLRALPDRFFAPGNFPDPAYVRAFTVDTLWSRNYGLKHVAYFLFLAHVPCSCLYMPIIAQLKGLSTVLFFL
jgi:hypothetical protein